MKPEVPDDAVSREVWLTRMALRTGIVKTTAYVLTNGTVIATRIRQDGKPVTEQFRKDEWYYTYDKALARAEQMRKLRITKLTRQLKRLASLTFKEPEQK